MSEWQSIETAPWDEYVILCVPSGYHIPELDYVQCIRHSSGYKNGCWVTAQNDHLADSHTDEPLLWKQVEPPR